MQPQRDDLEDEGPQSVDLEQLGGDGSETLPCPHCGADVYEHADRCQRCGRCVTSNSGKRAGTVMRWTVIAALAALFLYLLVR